MKSLFVLLLSIFIYSAPVHEGWSERLKEKIDATVKNTYAVETFSIKEVEIKEQEESKTSSVMTHNLYEVITENNTIGYFYISQAPSLKNKFDYIVLFDTDFEVKNTKVLIYREQHGRQIGTKRWLSQFFGMTPKDRPNLGDEIDGITGATISVKSMTKAVNDLLVSMDYLESQDFLND